MQKYARLIACVLTVFALLLVSDVGALVAIKVIAFLVVQIGVGALLLKRFLTKSCASSTGLFACVGVGFAFGATAFVFVDQVFIRYRFSEQIWYSSIGALLIFCAYLNRKSLSPSRAYTALGEISPKVMILVMVLALAILLSSWFWLIPAWSFLIVGSVFVTTDNGLFKRARLFGGADFFLMPSRSEPCGLTQMYAMRYGAIPVVSDTGGLRDTVEEWDSVKKTGTGFRGQASSEQGLNISGLRCTGVSFASFKVTLTRRWMRAQFRRLTRKWQRMPGWAP